MIKYVSSWGKCKDLLMRPPGIANMENITLRDNRQMQRYEIIKVSDLQDESYVFNTGKVQQIMDKQL